MFDAPLLAPLDVLGRFARFTQGFGAAVVRFRAKIGREEDA
jgi:hypothetical protein